MWIVDPTSRTPGTFLSASGRSFSRGRRIAGHGRERAGPEGAGSLGIAGTVNGDGLLRVRVTAAGRGQHDCARRASRGSCSHMGRRDRSRTSVTCDPINIPIVQTLG